MNFREWLSESESRVFRIDPTKVDDFASNPKTYYFTQSYSGAVDDTSRPPEWAGGEHGNFSKGLFAGKYNDIISYMIPRDIPWLVAHTHPKPTLYFNGQNLQDIQNYRPYISSFNAEKFEKNTKSQGEYFAENPPKPIKQVQVKDPLRMLKNKYVVIPLQDAQELKDKFQELKEKGADFDAEGMEFT